MSFVSDLGANLLKLSPQGDYFTLDNACTGVHIFGGTGSGKTSGSGRMLAGAYLRAGMGGVVTAAKPEEVDLWKRLAAEHGRQNSLLVFDDREGFNFLAYELARHGVDGIGSVTECLMRVLEASRSASSNTGSKGNEAFWEDATRQVLRYAIPAVYAATGMLSVANIIEFISSAPESREDAISPKWQDRSSMFQTLYEMCNRPKIRLPDRERDAVVTFWSEKFTAIPEKTRGNIVISVSATLDRFNHGRLRRAFCDRTTLVPELTFHGAVIVLAMPTLTWNDDGIIGQQLFKYIWQRAVLTRNSLEPKHRERPVFLWCDEAQETASSYDGKFLPICRGSKACTVYLTQSLPNYYSKLGEKGRDEAHTLVGNFKTHIFHSNGCPETNEYAARMIGKVIKRHATYNESDSRSVNRGMSTGDNENRSSSWGYGSGSQSGQSGAGSNRSSNSGGSRGSGHNWGENRGESTSQANSRGYSEQMQFAIEAGEFGQILKTGGRANNNEVTGIWYQNGRTFKSTGVNTMMGIFKQ